MYDNFDQKTKIDLIPNSIYDPKSQYNINNVKTNSFVNLNTINNNENNHNYSPMSSFSNSLYHHSQYFSTDNNFNNEFSLKRKNEELQKKYATYRKPEYVHTNYRTVSDFPSDDNLNEVFDDPVFLEGKLEDQNKIKVKVMFIFFKLRFLLKLLIDLIN